MQIPVPNRLNNSKHLNHEIKGKEGTKEDKNHENKTRILENTGSGSRTVFYNGSSLDSIGLRTTGTAGIPGRPAEIR